MHSNLVLIIFKGVALLLLALVVFLIYSGYFFGAVFIAVPATAKPTPARSHLAAVYLSGDMGYRVGMGQKIGNRLAADGISVLAVNSMRYFKSHRSHADVEALCAEAIQRALRLGHAEQVVVIGHSLGADALQMGLSGLPSRLRTKVRAVVLIVPTSELYLQISPGEMLDWSMPDGPVLPTLRQLNWSPLTCIFGKDETDSPCPQLTAGNARKIGLPGGHALEWDIDAVHQEILSAIDQSQPQTLPKFQRLPM